MKFFANDNKPLGFRSLDLTPMRSSYDLSFSSFFSRHQLLALRTEVEAQPDTRHYCITRDYCSRDIVAFAPDDCSLTENYNLR